MLYVSYAWTDPANEDVLLASLGFGFGASLFDDRGSPRSYEDLARLKDDIEGKDPEHPDRKIVILSWQELL